MNEMLILAGITVVAWLGLLYLRVPSSIAFLSLLIGQLLSKEAGDNVYDFLRAIAQADNSQYFQVALLVLPLLLTILLLRNRVPQGKWVVEAVPTLLVVALTILLLSDLIPQLKTILDTATKDQLASYKSIVVVASSVSALLSAWLSYPKGSSKKSKKHH